MVWRKLKEFQLRIRRRWRSISRIDWKIDGVLPEIRRYICESELLSVSEPGISSEQLLMSGELIVSLTSYGRRLYDAAYAVQSIMRQTVRPNRIILWLYEEDMGNIPEMLLRLRGRGLEIRPVHENLRSYTKLVPALMEFPDATIITIDDDIIYEYDLVERLLKGHKNHPQDICAARVHKFTRNADGSLRPYNLWRWMVPDTGVDKDFFFTGVGGVLYPPRSLADDVTDSSLFMRLAPMADDVWFNYMARIKGTPVRRIETRDVNGCDYVENRAFITEGLLQVNTKGECLNDKQIRAVAEHYGLFL